MQNSFQFPLELMHLSDDEFWNNIDQLDQLSEQIEMQSGGFAITMNTGDKQLQIPFIRFKKTLPSNSS